MGTDASRSSHHRAASDPVASESRMLFPATQTPSLHTDSLTNGIIIHREILFIPGFRVHRQMISAGDSQTLHLSIDGADFLPTAALDYSFFLFKLRNLP